MLVNSTLKLEVDKQTVNYVSAWSVGQPAKSSATITVVQHEGIMYLVTNAHAVANSTYLKVKFNQGSTELPVTPVWVDPIMDVAIVETTSTEAEAFLGTKVKPLEINTEFQPSSTEVNAYGYPTGGKSLSFTKGHISRTEVSTIAHSRLPGITVQTSAPINPGNSGGPITIVREKQEECIGIVSQGASSLSNVGYFIPACTIVQTIENYKRFGALRARQFIDYVTVPQVSFEWQTLKNPSLRSELEMQDSLESEPLGIRVSQVPPKSCAYNHLREGDVILEIDGHQIHADGNVQVKELENPISYLYLLQRKKYLDEIEFVIQRKNDEGESETLKITIRLTEQLGRSIVGPKTDKPLKYHIQPSGKNGGYVFVRCTQPLMDTFTTSYSTGQKVIVDKSNVPPMFGEFSRLSPKKDGYELVVLQEILVSEDTDGYENFALNRGGMCESDRVTEVNGEPIANLWDLVVALTKDPRKPSLVKFANGKELVIAPEAAQVREALKSKYQIAFFTSPKVAPILQLPFLDEINQLNKEEGAGNSSAMSLSC
ncbi:MULTISPECIES: S1C family serine protease [unclassified Legionella]|uniref:S1C family serine protease n=1 Tax=unclassified Legionella TaxID=2622702 RepID=UPI001E4D5162|nr:S1C family serine protease [Legionella sp. 31fI33]MCC5013845.1 trypsin-like peptidase domain-containing protein [Legionella sp. 31fI33]